MSEDQRRGSKGDIVFVDEEPPVRLGKWASCFLSTPRKTLDTEACVSLPSTMPLALYGRGKGQHKKSPGCFWGVLGELVSTAARWANEGHRNLYLTLVSKEELVRDMKTGSCDPELMGSHLLMGVREENRRLQMPDISAADFGLFWGVLLGISLSAAWKGSRALCSWSSRTSSSKHSNGLYQNSFETGKRAQGQHDKLLVLQEKVKKKQT